MYTNEYFTCIPLSPRLPSLFIVANNKQAGKPGHKDSTCTDVPGMTTMRVGGESSLGTRTYHPFKSMYSRLLLFVIMCLNRC